jgi:hypothetical protein
VKIKEVRVMRQKLQKIIITISKKISILILLFLLISVPVKTFSQATIKEIPITKDYEIPFFTR